VGAYLCATPTGFMNADCHVRDRAVTVVKCSRAKDLCAERLRVCAFPCSGAWLSPHRLQPVAATTTIRSLTPAVIPVRV
jgi:hypothetical protein